MLSILKTWKPYYTYSFCNPPFQLYSSPNPMSFLLRNVDGAIMAWNNGDNNAQKTIWFITSYCLFVILISTRICTVYTKGLDKLHFYMKWGKIESKNHPPILLSTTLFNLTWNHLSLVLSSNMVILWSLLTSHFSYWDILVNNIKKRKQNRKIKVYFLSFFEFEYFWSWALLRMEPCKDKSNYTVSKYV